MRPNVLYLFVILSKQAAAIGATSNDDLRPSIWCTAAFLYPGQDRLGNNALKNVFHGYCGLKGYEVSTDIDLNQCLENANGQIRWKEKYVFLHVLMLLTLFILLRTFQDDIHTTLCGTSEEERERYN